jgi:valyl-tRNA synthetase
VLDTWFSSQLWPFATLGWPDDTPELRAFYPTDVLSTARDILFLWVARMVMMGIEFTGQIPFKDVYNHSVIQAPDGRRMSKSLGTGIDPLTLIDGGERPPVFSQGGEFPAYGADALRFGLLAMSSTQDVRFSEEKVAQGAALVTKLFNASRFVLGAVGEAQQLVVAPSSATLEDRWIASRIQAAKRELAARLDEFDFSKAALGLYDVVFGELCDWYIEFVKPRLNSGEAALPGHLVWVLRETLLLAHPLIPFVTEELWAHLPAAARDEELLAAAIATPADESLIDGDVEAAVAQVIGAVQGVRSWRDGAGVKPGQVLEARLQGLADEPSAMVARMARLELVNDGREPIGTVPIPGGSVELLTGVDPAELAAKAAAERQRLEHEIARVDGKLANERFVANAPEDVVAAERAKRDRYAAELAALGAP